MSHAGVGPAHQVQRLRIRGAFLKKPLERVARILKLIRCQISGAHFSPDFVLTMCLVSRNNLLEVLNRISQASLLPGDAT